MDEFTRTQDEIELALMGWLEAQGVELIFDENETPRMTLADLIGPVTDKMRKAFDRMVGGLS